MKESSLTNKLAGMADKTKSYYGDEKSANVTWEAVTVGMYQAIPFAAASFTGVWYAHKYIPSFSRALGPSGKVALAISPAIAAWSYFSEVSIGKALKGDAPESKQLTLAQSLANFWCENTLVAYLGVVTPLYATILGHELSKPRPPGWKFSHAIIHTRVLGQAAAVCSLVFVFGGREYLKRSGAPFAVTA